MYLRLLNDLAQIAHCCMTSVCKWPVLWFFLSIMGVINAGILCTHININERGATHAVLLIDIAITLTVSWLGLMLILITFLKTSGVCGNEPGDSESTAV